MRKTPISIRFDPPLLEIARAESLRQRVSLTDLIQHAVKLYLENFPPLPLPYPPVTFTPEYFDKAPRDPATECHQ